MSTRGNINGFELGVRIALLLGGLLLLAALATAVIYKRYYPPAEPTALAPVEVATDWDDGWRDRLEQVCIEGHTYYYANRGELGAILAPKLNDDGTPVKCGPVVEKP